ncbi:MAG: AAA family ATPase [Deltaproteobacteria bacterium]|nr:AAA family ATPase [Deltaproteobacteria bacterium]
MAETYKTTDSLKKLYEALIKIIRGQNETVKLLLTGLIADGHVLIEDLPGLGKTTLAKLIGAMIDCSALNESASHIKPFRRIQFTPDLLPSDILGVTIYDAQSSSFRFQHGPVFAHVVLADEINRTGPKVQSAFLECMAEKQVTVDNITHSLDEIFFVIGTQNPLEIAGTYPLPLVQLDRFLLKIPMHYVSREVELEILRDAELIEHDLQTVQPIVTRADILSARRMASDVKVSNEVLQAIIDLAQETRSSSLFQFGASTRGAIMFKHALSAWALVNERDYVTADDFKYLAPFVFKHRMRYHSTLNNSEDSFMQLLLNQAEILIRKQSAII